MKRAETHWDEDIEILEVASTSNGFCVGQDSEECDLASLGANSFRACSADLNKTLPDVLSFSTQAPPGALRYVCDSVISKEPVTAFTDGPVCWYDIGTHHFSQAVLPV